MAVRVEGLIFAGVGSTGHDGVARFFADALGVELEVSGDVRRLLFANGSSLALVPPNYVEPPSETLLGFLVDDDGDLNAGYGFRDRHFRAPDGRRFELLDRNV